MVTGRTIRAGSHLQRAMRVARAVAGRATDFVVLSMPKRSRLLLLQGRAHTQALEVLPYHRAACIWRGRVKYRTDSCHDSRQHGHTDTNLEPGSANHGFSIAELLPGTTRSCNRVLRKSCRAPALMFLPVAHSGPCPTRAWSNLFPQRRSAPVLETDRARSGRAKGVLSYLVRTGWPLLMR
jgi:hypothetical protein